MRHANRDQIHSIETTQERQQVADHWGADQDVFGIYREGGAVEVQVLFVRHGTLVGTIAYAFDDWEFPDGEVMEAVLTQFYQATPHDVPDEILLPAAISDAECARRVPERAPGPEGHLPGARQRGDKLRLVEMARENAREGFARRTRGGDRGRAAGDRASTQAPSPTPAAADRVRRHRNLPGRGDRRRARVLRRRAALQGRLIGDIACASIVGTDDFASVAEVIERRFRPGEKREPLPDLLVIDGGLGQLAAGKGGAGAGGPGGPSGHRAREGTRRARPDGPRGDASAPSAFSFPVERTRSCYARTRLRSFLLQRARDEAHRFRQRVPPPHARPGSPALTARRRARRRTTATA
jgi:excinuclease ABC subunit C